MTFTKIIASIFCTFFLAASIAHAQSDRDLALMSLWVYEGNGGTPTSGWHLVQFASHSAGYAGALYRSVDGSMYVFAHRGTDGTTDLGTDYQLFREKLPPQFYRAEEFVLAAVTAHNVPENAIIHTGHSLGGFLAELMAADTTTPGKTAVWFDSPGTKPIMDKYPRFNQPVNSKGYLSSPHLINTANRHGTNNLHRIYPAFSPPSGALLQNPTLGLAHYTAQQHSIAGMLAVFDKQTGLPFYSSKLGSADWPVGPLAALESYSSYATNPIYWDMATRSMSAVDAKKFIDTKLSGLSGFQFRPPHHTLGNTQNGSGLTVWPVNQGYYEQGQYKNGVANGRAVHFPTGMDLTKFAGNFVGGKPASGEAFYSNGDSAKGQFSRGALNGQGTYTFRKTQTDIESISGNFTNHRPTNGSLKFRNGDLYQGDFRVNPSNGNSEPFGMGTLTVNEHSMTGAFLEGDTFKGKVTFTDGSSYEGEMKSGKRNGTGTQSFPNGNSISGNWQEDKKNGTMRFNFKDGYYKLVQYADGSQIGPIRHYRPDGTEITRTQISNNPNLSWWTVSLGGDWYVGPGGSITGLPDLQLSIGF